MKRWAKAWLAVGVGCCVCGAALTGIGVASGGSKYVKSADLNKMDGAAKKSDKPILRIKDDGIYVCGTPWCGKHGLQTNVEVPVQGICILRRGEENMIRKISAIDGYPDLYKQTYRPSEKDKMLKTLSMIKQMAERLPLYEMHCTISEEAAVMAWERMKP